MSLQPARCGSTIHILLYRRVIKASLLSSHSCPKKNTFLLAPGCWGNVILSAALMWTSRFVDSAETNRPTRLFVGLELEMQGRPTEWQSSLFYRVLYFIIISESSDWHPTLMWFITQASFVGVVRCCWAVVLFICCPADDRCLTQSLSVFLPLSVSQLWTGGDVISLAVAMFLTVFACFPWQQASPHLQLFLSTSENSLLFSCFCVLPHYLQISSAPLVFTVSN